MTDPSTIRADALREAHWFGFWASLGPTTDDEIADCVVAEQKSWEEYKNTIPTDAPDEAARLREENATLRARLEQVEGARQSCSNAIEYAVSHADIHWLSGWQSGDPDCMAELDQAAAALTPPARDKGEGS